MKKKCFTALTLASLLVVGSGFFRSAYSYKLLFMMPPILAGEQQGTGNVIDWLPLNDTGITWGGEYPTGNNSGCTGVAIDAQDCSSGRDATHNNDSDGDAGFSYTKLDSKGDPLSDQSVTYASTPWACVQDNVTGLIWEVKTDDGGLHDKDDTFTWYNTNPATNGDANGTENEGTNCFGYDNNTAATSATYCNTQAYMNRVNKAGWCGASDWRMPTIKELESLVHYGRTFPAIESNYFPNPVNTVNWSVWSGSPSAGSESTAWYVLFSNGFSDTQSSTENATIHLVRYRQ
ncbi:MAG: DUF1566 domain-containing protein [Candidatus Electrothrix sp. AU1_5]|nr:DUF1566 domain-containing protein [Candidatus Electrothrix gigas]